MISDLMIEIAGFEIRAMGNAVRRNEGVEVSTSRYHQKILRFLGRDAMILNVQRGKLRWQTSRYRETLDIFQDVTL